MYCDYWNLKKAPFDNVPDPTMYAACHASMENVISETLFAIQEADESFAAIISEPGLGKTLALHLMIDALNPGQYKTVFITNPSLSFPQLIKEIIGQLTGEPCNEIQKGVLLEILKNQLIACKNLNIKVVIFIDEANTFSPANLEDLRLLTNLQVDRHNLLTLVLAGNLELARRLEHPDQANLFQRIGSYGRIDKLPSQESVSMYIETRLKLAGTHIRIFADNCIPTIWEQSEYGVPRLINKICKLCLKAGETNQLDYITEDIVAQIAVRYQKLTTATVQIAPLRQSSESPFDVYKTATNAITDTPTEAETSSEQDVMSEPVQLETGLLIPFPNTMPAECPSEILMSDPADSAAVPSEEAIEREIPLISSSDQQQVTSSDDFEFATVTAMDEIQHFSEQVKPAASEEYKEEFPAVSIFPAEEPIWIDVEAPGAVEKKSDGAICQEPIRPAAEEGESTEMSNDEILVGQHRIQLAIPKDILKQVKSFNRESANKSAGFWAAQIIKNNPQLTRSPQNDPVRIWNEIKDNILKKIAL